MPNCRQYRPLSEDDMLSWHDSLSYTDSGYNLTQDMFLLVYDTTPIGVGGYTRIDWRNRKAELSFYVGHQSFVNNKEITNNALLSVVDYATTTLNLFKICFPIYAFNPNLPLYKKCLQEEYIAKKEYYWQGQYWDRIVLVKYFNET